jgi:hypothetical protein
MLKVWLNLGSGVTMSMAPSNPPVDCAEVDRVSACQTARAIMEIKMLAPSTRFLLTIAFTLVIFLSP